MPSLSDVESVGGRTVHHADGTFTGKIEGKAAVRAAAEMMRKAHRMMAVDGQTRQSRNREVTVQEPSGKRRVVWESQAEATCKKLGAREIVRRNPHLLYKNGEWYRREGSNWVREISH